MMALEVYDGFWNYSLRIIFLILCDNDHVTEESESNVMSSISKLHPPVGN